MKVKKESRITIVEVLPLFLGALGLIMVFSAASGISVYRRVVPVSFIKQLIIYMFAVVMFFVFSRIRPLLWKKLNGYLVVIAIALLIMTIFVGKEINYAKRWLYLGNISFQPSIFAQLALIIYLSEKKDFSKSILAISLVSGLIMIQPDISTALITAMLGTIMLFLNGTKPLKVLGFASLSLAAGVIFIMSRGYALQRITTYMNSESISNTVRAISTGGVSGLGLGSGMQKYFYIPLPDSDFIFSIVGEELGFTGCIMVLTMFLIYLICSARYSLRSKEDYNAILGVGLISLIFLNAIIHIFVALGSLPVTGVPLPFISSGGTALVVDFIAGGIIVSIAKNRDNIRRRNRRTYIPGSFSGR